MNEKENKPLDEEIVDAELIATNESDAFGDTGFGDTGMEKKESKLKKNLKQIGIWIAAFVGFGLVIFLLVYFLMVRPETLRNQVLTENNAEMETQLTEYRDDLDALQGEYDVATKMISTMDSTIILYDKYSAYNKLLNNLAQMQKAVIVNDTASTRVALANAQENLDKLEVLLLDYDASLAELLQERLTYLATTDSDADEVYQEIETMYVYLLELQETLFGDLY